MVRALALGVAMIAALGGGLVGGPAFAQEPGVVEKIDVRAEIAAATEAVNKVIPSLPGMGGDGVLPEVDLTAIHGLVGEAEKLLREARRRAQDIKSVHDEEWAVGYARAAVAMAQTADRLRIRLGWL